MAKSTRLTRDQIQQKINAYLDRRYAGEFPQQAGVLMAWIDLYADQKFLTQVSDFIDWQCQNSEIGKIVEGVLS